MNSDYYTAHAVDLESLNPALRQISSMVLKTLRKQLIRRVLHNNVRFYLLNPQDEFVFYDSRGKRMIASEAFKSVYQAGYNHALIDVCTDISAELLEREFWKLQSSR